jgi:hypothetical protein
MSNKKKPKRLRTPNISAAVARPTPAPAPERARGGSVAAAAESRVARPGPAPAATVFDYSYVKKDLRRIATLAGGFIVVLIALSFFINR